MRHLVVAKMEQFLQHTGNLILGSRPVSGDCHLDFQRSIFTDGDIMMDGCSNGNALRTSELQHWLHVLAEERSLDGKLVGQILVNDTRDTVKNLSQPQIYILLLAHINDTHDYQFCLVPTNTQHAIAHDVSPRIDAKEYLFRLWISFLHSWLSESDLSQRSI